MSSSEFFETVPVQTDFEALAEEGCYSDLPDDWIVGTADIIWTCRGGSMIKVETHL